MNDLFLGRALGVALGFAIAIPLHHFAHARVAIARGDGTPRLMGRATLSIKPHVDTLGSLVLPAVWTVVALFGELFPFVGWGKSQALSPHRLRDGKRDTIIVSLAGPAATFVLGSVGAAVATRMPFGIPRQIIGGAALIAIFLTVWELLPMPGRDGGRILAQFLSPTARMKFDDLAQYDVLFVLGAFFLLQRVGFAAMTNPLCRLFAGDIGPFPACGALLI